MTTVSPAPAAPVTERAKVRTLTQEDARTGLLLISPTLVIVLAIVVVPLLWSVLLAFQEVRLITVGRHSLFSPLTIENFRRVFTSDVLWSSLRTTLIYTAASTALTVLLGLIAALAVRRPFPGRTFVRASMLLPYVAPVVAVTFVWKIMLNPEFGIINEWGQRLFGWDDPIAFLSQRSGELSVFGLEIPVPVGLLTVIAFEGWRYFPFAFLFLLARVSALSADVEEAATVDGATPLQTFRYVILPQLMPVIAVVTVLRTIWTFNEFDDIFLLTGGAAGTQVLSIRVYELLTVQQNVGAAAAQSVFMAGVLLVLISIYFNVMRRRGGEVL
ncbi:MAG: sugar ABC transporter permease [Jiangellaceae bacterium]|nr:sugar ABC transporter permease [Jiangellaceae bacterium]